ncbi:MAG: hypothetical protein N3F07_03880 [Candidatus Micrarchaeota archaeon]|nr:hypothetical protein [Candidatus Micrarchaeota archaeon]
MPEEMTYKKLRDLAREEKAQPGLIPLPEDFYSTLQAFLSAKHSEMESDRSVLQMREFENALAIASEIITIRQQKILFKAIRDGGEHGKTEGMTRNEHELYDRFCAVLADARADLERMLSKYSNRRMPQKPGEEEASNSLKRLRFIKEVPAYIGPDNRVFGPYSPGQESELPQSEAAWLVKGKLAEEIQ